MKMTTPSRDDDLAKSDHFALLPLELKQLIFEYLSPSELRQFALASKSNREMVIGYLPRLERMIKVVHTQSNHQTEARKQHYTKLYQEMGSLHKLLTCLMSTRRRFECIAAFLNENLCTISARCGNPVNCVVSSCCGVYLRAFVQGWAESELVKVIPNFTRAEVVGVAYDRMLEVAIRHPPGVHTSLEVHVRTFYRTMFLDAHRDIDDRAFWIRRLMADRPLEDRAKLLFLLYGPLNFSNACIIRFDTLLATNTGDGDNDGNEDATDHDEQAPTCRRKVARLDESLNTKPCSMGDENKQNKADSECICATRRERTSPTTHDSNPSLVTKNSDHRGVLRSISNISDNRLKRPRQSKCFEELIQSRVYCECALCNSLLLPEALILHARLLWNDVSRMTIANANQLGACFGELGRTLNILFASGSLNTLPEAIRLIRRLVNMPTEWLSENVASLLVVCGRDLLYGYVEELALAGELFTLAALITSMSLVLVKVNQPCIHLIGVIERILATLNTKANASAPVQEPSEERTADNGWNIYRLTEEVTVEDLSTVENKQNDKAIAKDANLIRAEHEKEVTASCGTRLQKATRPRLNAVRKRRVSANANARKEQRSFLMLLSNSFRDVITDVTQNGEGVNLDRSNDLALILSAQVSLFTEFAIRAFHVENANEKAD